MDKWIEICREHIAEQIEKLKNGRFNLYVPPIIDRVKYTAGMHYHSTPEMSSQIIGTHSTKFPAQSFHHEHGDICVIPAMMPHFGTEIKNEASLFMVIAFEHVELSFIRGEGNPGELPHSTEILTIKTKKKENIKNYMNNICDIFKIKHKASESALQGILLACFSELMMILDEEELTKIYDPHPKVSKAQRLVASNLGDIRLNVDFISKLIPCSPVYLSQLFHMKTGVKLSAYINEKRLKYSKRLIKETNMNISEIAYSCGYSDPGYFTRVFRKQSGMAPLEFRKH